MRLRVPFRKVIVLLGIAALGLSGAARAESPKEALVFYADKQVSNDLWAPLFAAVKEDLAAEDSGSAGELLDRNPRLLSGSELVPGEEFSRVVQIKLLGRCDVVQQAYRPLKPGPLGWVLRVQGEIQPYVYVDCTRMAQVLNPTTLGMSNAQRTQAMTQAIAHVLVHEWIHIATQNAGHTTHGISQAELTPHALVTEPETPTTETGQTRTIIVSDRTSLAAEN